MYAIIATGGKQYRVSQGDVIFVEKIEQDVDSTIDFDVLMLAGDDGVKVGNPLVLSLIHISEPTRPLYI